MTVLNRMDQEGLSQEVTLSQRPEGGQEKTCRYLGGKGMGVPGIKTLCSNSEEMGALGRV